MLEYLSVWDIWAAVFVAAFIVYGGYQNRLRGILISLIMLPAMLAVCFFSLVNLDPSLTMFVLIILSSGWIVFALLPVKKIPLGFFAAPLASSVSIILASYIEVGYIDPFLFIGIPFLLVYTFFANFFLGVLIYSIRAK
jgi:hypothetical protein